MTESENIDSTQSTENVTVTSDGAFERVTSDVKMEEWGDWWFLKQNTAWLVQEIPNISFLDVSDTLLESNKTLHGKKNWILRVWLNAKSIETQPQDICRLTYTWTAYDVQSYDDIMPFDEIETVTNESVFSISNHRCIISEAWIYRISYWWSIQWWWNEQIDIWIWRQSHTWSIPSKTWYVVSDAASYITYWIISWWKTARIDCDEWDELYMFVQSENADIRVRWWNETYMEVQFLQYKL